MMKLSIILPCYNVSKYISRCLDTILAIGLSKNEYEILCVDDCSTDNTPDIIRDYQKQYPNLRLIQHTENKASGGARNTGLRAAKGEYVWYVDPDDMIYPEHVSALVELCMNKQLDVLCFNYEDIDEQENILAQPIVFKDTSVMTGLAFARNVFGDEIIYHLGYVWRIMYKRQFLLDNGIFFPEHTCWQDTTHMAETILKAQKIMGRNRNVYRYWHHDASVCGSFNLGYSGIKIYQWAFNAGYDVLNLSNEIRDIDKHYSDLFYRHACNHYFNRIPLYLCRTSTAQRANFYKQVKMHSDRVAGVYPYLNRISKILLCPLIGPVSAHILSAVYKQMHKK